MDKRAVGKRTSLARPGELSARLLARSANIRYCHERCRRCPQGDAGFDRARAAGFVRSSRCRGEAPRCDRQKVDGVDKRFDGVDKRFDSVDKRFENVDKKFDDVELRAEQRHQDLLRHMDARLDDLGFLLRKSMEVKEIVERVTALEDRMKQLAQ